MKTKVKLNSKELGYIETALERMIWFWQAQRGILHPDTDKHLKQYRRLYQKITRALRDLEGR
jgi:hypothetical protein